MIRLAPDQKVCGAVLEDIADVPGSSFMLGIYRHTCQRPAGHDGECVAIRTWDKKIPLLMNVDGVEVDPQLQRSWDALSASKETVYSTYGFSPIEGVLVNVNLKLKYESAVDDLFGAHRAGEVRTMAEEQEETKSESSEETKGEGEGGDAGAEDEKKEGE